MQSTQGPSDRQVALWVSIIIGAGTAGLTIFTFWLIYYLALYPDLREAQAAENAPYDWNTGVQAILDAEPNVPTDNRDPWLGEDAWNTAIQAGQDYIQQFPQPQNIQVLTGMNTEQLWNYMQRMSAGLGVSCQYCHNIQNYSDYTIVQKTSGLRMLQLVQDLNAQYIVNLPNWRGNYIQCDTCHNNEAINLPAVSTQFQQSTPPIDVTVQPLDAQGMPVTDTMEMSLKEASLYYYYNYQIWDPFDVGEYASGRGSLALTYPGGRTQDQVTINQNTMNSNSWSLGVGCTYCHNSRNFYAYEADIEAPQFIQEYAINRLKAQRMMLMTTFMAQNWTQYNLPRVPLPEVEDPPLDGDQYYIEQGGTYYAIPGCYTCHRGNIVPKTAINAADIPEGDAGMIVFPSSLTGLAQD
jgi:photosynthetic reaction center cytochrome c subunit